MRSDAPLIRHLTEKFGAATAAEWQRPPLVLLPDEGFGRYLVEHDQELGQLHPTLEHLPWEDVVLDLPWARQELMAAIVANRPAVAKPLSVMADRGRGWIRIRTLPNLLRQTNLSAPWLRGPQDLLAPFKAAPDRWLVVEAWESKTIRPEGGHGLPAYPDVSLVPRDRPGDFTTIAHLYPNPFCRLARAYGAGFCNVARCSQPDPQLAWPCAGSEVIMSVGVRLAVLILAYLAQSEEYPVEVRPAAAQPRSTRHGTAKPWVRDDLAHIILIDPHRVHDYRPTAQGTPHASPIPHQRRGHWRHLRAECFHTPRKIWIRPTWVGPAVWKARGQIYRVLTDRVSQGDGKGNLSA